MKIIQCCSILISCRLVSEVKCNIEAITIDGLLIFLADACYYNSLILSYLFISRVLTLENQDLFVSDFAIIKYFENEHRNSMKRSLSKQNQFEITAQLNP